LNSATAAAILSGKHASQRGRRPIHFAHITHCSQRLAPRSREMKNGRFFLLLQVGQSDAIVLFALESIWSYQIACPRFGTDVIKYNQGM